MLRKIPLVIALVLFPTTIVLAASSFFPCSGFDCTLCDLGIVINNLIKLAVEFGAAAATVAVLAGGAMIAFMGDQSSWREKGKQTIFGAVIGLAIVLSAWVLVDSVFKVLVGDTGEQTNKIGQPWNQLQCPSFANPTTTK